jgi:hypothetical protein
VTPKPKTSVTNGEDRRGPVVCYLIGREGVWVVGENATMRGCREEGSRAKSQGEATCMAG